MKDWIKMSERKPTEVDLPVWVAGDPDEIAMYICTALPVGPCVTHWMQADIPEPPKEPTQSQKDMDEFYAWRSGLNTTNFTMEDIWLSAVAHERAEVMKLLPERWPKWGTSEEVAAAVFLRKLRARCTP